MNQVCIIADNASSVFSINKENSYSESKFIQEYMFQVLPSKSRALHYNYSGVRTFDTISGDHCLCRNTLVCQLHPAVKTVTSIYNPHFILCARDPTEKPVIEAPIEFQHFLCADDTFIGATLQCDGIPDCPEAEDEYNCSNVCTSNSVDCFSECVYPTCRCHDYYYQCLSGECVRFDRLCNGQHDCSKGEDEHGCGIAQKASHNVSLTLQDVDSNTGFCYGSAEYLPCYSQRECYSLQSLCQYDTVDGIILYCDDGTHLGKYCEHHVCNHQYKCEYSYCIPTRKVCDGTVDCPKGDDEEYCAKMACPGHLRCSNTTFCVPPHEICDGVPHCPFGEDEKTCMKCPSGCLCKGNIISCRSIHEINKNLVISPLVLLLDDSHGMFETMLNNPFQLEGTFFLKIHHGDFQKHLQQEQPALTYCKSLRLLQLSNQGTEKLHKEFIYGPLVMRSQFVS